MEGATRFRGRRPDIATRPPGARSAKDPSPCPSAVCQPAPSAGKSDPSRGRDRRVGNRDDRAGLRDYGDAAGARRGPTPGAPPRDTPPSNTHARDHRTHRSQRGRCSAGRPSGEGACPRSRSGGAFRLDTTVKPVAQESRLARSRRSIEAVTEGLEYPLQALTSFVAARSVRDGDQTLQTRRAMDADAAVDAQTAPTAAWKSRGEREIPTSVHSPFLLFVFRKRSGPDRRRSTFTRFQMTADKADRPRQSRRRRPHAGHLRSRPESALSRCPRALRRDRVAVPRRRPRSQG